MKYNRMSLLLLGIIQSTLSFSDENIDEILILEQNDTTFQPSAEQQTQQAIQAQLIRNTHDLVRYSTDVGVADNGRFTKGFSMRGVEGNRVGISIDGVNLPDSEENSLYARYGNFNASRLTIDSELVKSIEIVKGSDSLGIGSGALGGGVLYHTLDARDLVFPNKHFGSLLRSGYASKNREWVNTVGFGYIGSNFESVLLYSQRRGHELASRGGGDYSSKNQLLG